MGVGGEGMKLIPKSKEWRYLYRAVDSDGNTIDFLLTAHRDKEAALRFFKKAIRQNGQPDGVTMDPNGANKAAVDKLNKEKITLSSLVLSLLMRQNHVFYYD
ncbi:transposase (fragment) [Xenorhabdus bovienii str. Jollieti]|uniref:Transposase n=1 Tax=Xenorhabdus bovienii (strain SS-2004) TaxID=406818 RepID=D3V4W3_XENBS